MRGRGRDQCVDRARLAFRPARPRPLWRPWRRRPSVAEIQIPRRALDHVVHQTCALNDQAQTREPRGRLAAVDGTDLSWVGIVPFATDGSVAADDWTAHVHEVCKPPLHRPIQARLALSRLGNGMPDDIVGREPMKTIAADALFRAERGHYRLRGLIGSGCSPRFFHTKGDPPQGATRAVTVGRVAPLPPGATHAHCTAGVRMRRHRVGRLLSATRQDLQGSDRCHARLAN